jgi:hypothetical protein
MLNLDSNFSHIVGNADDTMLQNLTRVHGMTTPVCRVLPEVKWHTLSHLDLRSWNTLETFGMKRDLRRCTLLQTAVNGCDSCKQCRHSGRSRHHILAVSLLLCDVTQWPVRSRSQTIAIFFCSLFNEAFSVTQNVQRRMMGDKCVMNCEGCERKRSWPRYYPGIYLEGLRKTTKILSQVIQSPGKIWTRNLPKTKQECLELDHEGGSDCDVVRLLTQTMRTYTMKCTAVPWHISISWHTAG